jgi:drug/metabolite transporter (DMT)-like permease
MQQSDGVKSGHAAGGFAYAIASAMSFGLIPLFALPVMSGGMDFLSVLIYRFAISCLFLFPILLLTHQRLKISLSEIGRIVLLALFYCGSALFLFWSYQYMSSGKATTIHFMYPVFTAIIMMLFFHERFSWTTLTAVLIAVAGVALLADEHGDGGSISWVGLLIVLSSGVYYAIYLVAVNQMKIRKMGSLKLTFYVMFFGLFILIGVAEMLGNGVAVVSTFPDMWRLVCLALVSTVFSNIMLLFAIKRLGSTYTSIMGAFEPLTAVCMGILCFHEEVTVLAVTGIVCIIAAISLLVYCRNR